MNRVEIACFIKPEHARLALDFLTGHGIAASIPTDYAPRRWVTPPTRVYVEQTQAAKAIALFNKILAGDYADEDPLTNTEGGLGAALAEAILPAPGFRPPTRLQGLAPLIVLLILAVAAVVGPTVLRLFTDMGR